MDNIVLWQPAPGWICTQEAITVVCISTAQSRQTASSWLWLAQTNKHKINMGWSRLNISICWAIVSAEMSDWAEGRENRQPCLKQNTRWRAHNHLPGSRRRSSAGRRTSQTCREGTCCSPSKVLSFPDSSPLLHCSWHFKTKAMRKNLRWVRIED